MRKLYHALCKAELVFCGTGFVLLISLVLLSAILRLFRLSMAWNIDLALFLLAWTAFLGADIAWRSGQLIGIDLITKHLPPAFQKLVHLVLYFVISGALIIIIVYGSRLAWMERTRTYQSIPIPYSLVIMSLVVAGLSMFLTTIVKIKRCIMSFRQDGKAGVAR